MYWCSDLQETFARPLEAYNAYIPIEPAVWSPTCSLARRDVRSMQIRHRCKVDFPRIQYPATSQGRSDYSVPLWKMAFQRYRAKTIRVW